ncbi:MAG TPA: DUF5696 domain-containing protein, partial [Armatimonadota bacterium]|nr:DUF5696 domain-containing protein [Armatimonadota bacterium]
MRRPPGARSRQPDDLTLCPIAASGSARGSFAWDAEQQAYTLNADGVGYRVAVGAPEERSMLLRLEGRVGEGPWQPLLRDAGMLVREPEGAVLPPQQASERCELQALEHGVRGRAVVLTYQELLDSVTLRRTVQVRLSGRALEVHVEASAGGPAGYCGFSLGEVGPEGARAVSIPGVPDPLFMLEPEGYLCAYADRYRGAASAYPAGTAFYRPNLDGVTAAIDEVFYITLSAHPLGPLPGLWRPAAPYRGALDTRVTLDFFSGAPYEEDRRLLGALQQYGLSDVLLIYRNWQHYGYDRRSPLLYPADGSRGDNDSFRDMLASLAAGGWRVALREEYAEMARDSPYYDEKVIALWPDGTPRKSRSGQGFAVAAGRMLDFARLETTKVARNYGTTAVFVDAHTAWNPEDGLRQVDARPDSGTATEAEALRQVEGLFAFLRDVHQGPVVGAAGEGEARFDTFCAGAAEGVIRGPDGGRSAPLIVDYELREVRPVLAGIGAGSYRQFCQHGSGEPVAAREIDWDAYRATEIALGHAGYVGNYRVKPGPRGIPFPGGSAAAVVREYYLLRALQELYLSG